MILAPTWKLFFASRESNDAGNKNPAAYLSAWSDEVSPEAKLSLLSNDPNTVVLAGDNNNSIMILHSFKNLGGTILSPADKLVCLIGLNRIAPPLIVNEVAISENCNITTPSADAIIACNDPPRGITTWNYLVSLSDRRGLLSPNGIVCSRFTSNLKPAIVDRICTGVSE